MNFQPLERRCDALFGGFVSGLLQIGSLLVAKKDWTLLGPDQGTPCGSSGDLEVPDPSWNPLQTPKGGSGEEFSGDEDRFRVAIELPPLQTLLIDSGTTLPLGLTRIF